MDCHCVDFSVMQKMACVWITRGLSPLTLVVHVAQQTIIFFNCTFDRFILILLHWVMPWSAYVVYATKGMSSKMWINLKAKPNNPPSNTNKIIFASWLFTNILNLSLTYKSLFGIFLQIISGSLFVPLVFMPINLSLHIL